MFRPMLGAGDPMPPARVWLRSGADAVTTDSIAAGAPCLILFYLYDWSST